MYTVRQFGSIYDLGKTKVKSKSKKQKSEGTRTKVRGKVVSTSSGKTKGMDISVGKPLVFSVHEQAYIEIFIYDIMGREVRRFYIGLLAPGTYQYTWDGYNNEGERLAIGLYFATLKASGETLQMEKVPVLPSHVDIPIVLTNGKDKIDDANNGREYTEEKMPIWLWVLLGVGTMLIVRGI